MAGEARDNDDRTRMKKATVTCCVLAVLTAAWLGWSQFRTKTVQDLPPPPVDPADRVATARHWRGETIRQAKAAAGVDYPGEVFIRWLKHDAVLELWARTQKTICFVTHSIPEAVYLSTRIVVMSPRPGRVTDVIESTLPNERPLHIRETPEFLAIAHRVREGLHAGHSYED